MNKKSELPKLVLTCDLGASLTKAIAQVYPNGLPKAVIMNPEVADVEKESVAGLNIDSAAETGWICINKEYYVLGSIAKTVFAGNSAIQYLKHEYALPKIAGIMWLACRNLEVEQANIYIHLLLPPGEMSDGEGLGKELVESLKQGVLTPTGNLKLKIRNFLVSLEGAGIVSYRRRFLGEKFNHKSIAVLMIGYRNASFILVESGSQSKSEATDLGMNWIVKRFTDLTNVGLSHNDLRLTKALTEALRGNFDSLQPLSRKTKQSDIEADMNLFQQCLPTARKEYCRALVRWIRNVGAINEILICGGTAAIIREELTNHFTQANIPVVWDGGVEVPALLDTYKLGSRLADVWAAHTMYIRNLDQHFGHQRQEPLIPKNVTSITQEGKSPFLTMHKDV